jgi:hypothetical protein
MPTNEYTLCSFINLVTITPTYSTGPTKLVNPILIRTEKPISDFAASSDLAVNQYPEHQDEYGAVVSDLSFSIPSMFLPPMFEN